MNLRDYYQVLGIERDTSAAGVRAAYARLAKLHHPDTAGHLPERLHEVQEAYRCLADPDARSHHDRVLAEHDRIHAARLHALERRLHRYDRRHPRAAQRPRRGLWRALLLVVQLPVAAVRAIWRRSRSA